MVTAGANQVKHLFHLHFYMFCMPLILLCKVVRLCSPICFCSLVLWTHSFFPVQHVFSYTYIFRLLWTWSLLLVMLVILLSCLHHIISTPAWHSKWPFFNDILAGIVTPRHFIPMFFTLVVGMRAPMLGRAVNLVNLVFNLVTGSSKARRKWRHLVGSSAHAPRQR